MDGKDSMVSAHSGQSGAPSRPQPTQLCGAKMDKTLSIGFMLYKLCCKSHVRLLQEVVTETIIPIST